MVDLTRRESWEAVRSQQEAADNRTQRIAMVISVLVPGLVWIALTVAGWDRPWKTWVLTLGSVMAGTMFVVIKIAFQFAGYQRNTLPDAEEQALLALGRDAD